MTVFLKFLFLTHKYTDEWCLAKCALALLYVSVLSPVNRTNKQTVK